MQRAPSPTRDRDAVQHALGARRTIGLPCGMTSVPTRDGDATEHTEVSPCARGMGRHTALPRDPRRDHPGPTRLEFHALRPEVPLRTRTPHDTLWVT